MFRIAGITEKGIGLLDEAVAGKKLTFTRMEYGDGILPGLSDIVADEATIASYRAVIATWPNKTELEKLNMLKTDDVENALSELIGKVTALVNKCGDIGLSAISNETNYIKLRGKLLPETVAKDFKARELGVFAKLEEGEEVLFAYFSAVDYLKGEEYDTSDYIIVSAIEGQEHNVVVNVATDKASNIAIEYSLDIYTTKKDLEELKTTISEVYATKEEVKNNEVDLSSCASKEEFAEHKDLSDLYVKAFVYNMNKLHSDLNLGKTQKWKDSTLTEIDDEYNSLFLDNFTNYFYNSRNLKQIKNFFTFKAVNMKSMFYDCASLTSIPQMDTSNVTNMNSMFRGCSSLTSIPQMDTSNVTDMYAVFNGCSSLTSIPQMDTSKVTNMNSMFNGCSSLTSIPQMDTSNVASMNSMFYGCASLTSIPQIDTSKVTNMDEMFRYCKALTSIPSMDTSNIASMINMYGYCSKLTSIPQMDTSNVTNMNTMFFYCSSLTSIPSMDTSNVTSMNKMFYGCTSLTKFNDNPLCKVTPWQISVDFDVGSCPLDRTSILKVFNGAKTVSGKTITISATTNGYLSEEDKKIITDKGWTISVKS